MSTLAPDLLVLKLDARNFDGPSFGTPGRLD